MTLDPEAKKLANIPKGEDNEVRKSIIRTTIKNENLLARKMESKVKKKQPKKKLLRASNLDGVLASKIQQSIERAKYVQGARKAGWEQINKEAEPEQGQEPLIERLLQNVFKHLEEN